MNIVSRQYIAGLVDGEAWIGFSKHPMKSARLGYNFQPTVNISMRNNDDVLQFIADKYKGYFYSRYIRPSRPNANPIGILIIQWCSVLPFLKDIVPYLHTKRQQAELMIKYFSESYPQKRGQNGRFMGDEAILKKIDYYNQFKILNSKGKGIIPKLLELRPPKPTISPNWKPLFTKEELYNLYVRKGLSGSQIATIKNCSCTTVDSYRKRYGIQARSQSSINKSRKRDSKGMFQKSR